MSEHITRAQRLGRALSDLLAQAPEIEAAAVVSFDGLPMASALPPSMNEDRVAAMSAALLSLGERAAEGLGRGELSQVYIEGEHGTVFLVSADNEAVLVAVAAKGAKAGLMMFEVRHAAATVADVLRAAPPVDVLPEIPRQEPAYAEPAYVAPAPDPLTSQVETPHYAPTASPGAPPEPERSWASYLPNGTPSTPSEPPAWS